MASGSIYLVSDSDDLTVTKVSERHLEYVKSRLAHYILESKDLSAEIHHVRGQSAQMVFSIGTQPPGMSLYFDMDNTMTFGPAFDLYIRKI